MPEHPYVEVAIHIGAWNHVAEALPDTGYDGAVIIPASVSRLLKDSTERTPMRVGDGHGLAVGTWEGVLEIDELRLEVAVHALGDDFIIGREVLDLMEICFYFGKEVRIRLGEDA